MVHSWGMTSSQPPGWYPDATMPGHERWWDGAAWSPVTRPSSTAAPEPAPYESTTDPHQGYATSGQDAGSTGYGSPAQNPDQNPSPNYGTPTSDYGNQGYGQPAQPTPQAPWGAPQEPAVGQAPWGAPQDPAAGQAPWGAPQDPAPSPYPGYSQPAGTPYPPQYGAYPPPANQGYAAAAPYGYPGAPSGTVYASRGLRLVARIVDGILTGAVTLALAWPILQPIFKAASDATTAGQTVSVTAETFKITLIGLVVSGIYEVTLLGLKGATLGKMLVGVRVQPIAGGKLSWGQAALRWAGAGVPSAIPTIGGLYGLLNVLWCLWDSKRQCLHDKLPKTVVVPSR